MDKVQKAHHISKLLPKEEAGTLTSKEKSRLNSYNSYSEVYGKIAGSIEWDGADPYTLVLKNISKSALPKIGDTVLTSPYSSSFPDADDNVPMPEPVRCPSRLDFAQSD